MAEIENTEYKPEIEFDEQGFALPLSLGKAAYRVLDRRNGEKLALLNVTETVNYTDYIVLCTAKSTTHVRSLADEVEYRLGLCGVKAESREGKGDGNTWIVLDYGYLLVHIFTSEARDFYSLDRLFRDAENIAVESDIKEEN